MSRRSWSLGRRLAAACAVAAVVLVLVSVVATVMGLRVRADQQRVVDDIFRAYRISSDLFVTAVDAETSVRGYALTGEEEFLEHYASDSDESAEDFAELVALVEADPAVSAALARAAESAGRWREDWADPTVRAVGAGGPQAVSAADVARGKALFDQVRADYTAYVDTLLAARDAALDRLEASTRWLVGLAVGGILATVTAAALLSWALRRWVTEPLARLGREVRLVKDGRYDHRVEPQGPPEVAELAFDVDAMRRSLVATYGAAVTAREEVEAASRLLEAQAQELQRSNAELEQFAYVASHDLQEPLRKVASFCQMLERRYKGQLDDRADQYIAFAVDGAKRMQALINDLLMFSRVGRTSGGFQPVELDAVVQRALANLSLAIEDAGATVTVEPLPVVDGDPSLLTQLFQNLIGNSVKFRGSEPPRVHVGAELTEQDDGSAMWELRCRDNGIGLDPQYADRIFVIFQRLHPKDEYGGTGIGLSLCKKIVEHHGGRIWLDTTGTADGGATFRWTLPVRAPEDAGRAPAVDGARSAAGAAGADGAAAPDRPYEEPSRPPQAALDTAAEGTTR